MLMEDEELVLLFDIARKEIAEKMLFTQPNETEKREDLYHQAYGLTLLERQMTAIKIELSKENI